MCITINLLKKFFDAHEKTEVLGAPFGEDALTRWELLREPIPSLLPDTVYISDNLETVCQQTQSSCGHLVFCAGPAFQKSQLLHTWQGCILLIQTEQPQRVVQSIQERFYIENRKSALSAVLLKALTEGARVQTLADAAYPFLKNPLVIFDSSYRIAGVTRQALHEQGSQVTDMLLENGGFSSGDYTFANRGALHSRVKRSKIPIMAFHDQMKINQLLISVSTEKDYGHIVVNEFDHTFTEIDKELLMVLRSYVYLQMKHDELLHQNGKQPSEHFILDLLDEAIVVSSAYQAFIHQLDRTFPDNMRCLVISTELTPGAVNMLQIRNQIEYLFANSRIIVYEKKILALIPVMPSGSLSETSLTSFRAFCVKNGLYASLSNNFSDIMEIRSYFNQALRALEAARAVHDEPGCYRYEEYYLVHLKNQFLQREPLEVFLCPTLKYLSAHDDKHNTELAYTLYMYYLNDRNLVQTAKAMNMHRSSLNYRFDKIIELLGELPASAAERYYYILSYQFQNSASEL